jgi:hypothetical protein
MISRTNWPSLAVAAGLAFIPGLSAAESATSPVNQAPTRESGTLSAGSEFSAAALQPVKLTDANGKVTVEIGGRPFTEYNYQDAPRPYCYPVFGVDETPMTRNFPMKDVAGEERDHKHHRGVWIGHQKVNGQNFWVEDGKNGKIVHQKFTKISSGKVGEISSENEWIGADGKPVCSDSRTLRFSGDGKVKFLDVEVTLRASHGDVVFGDDKDAFVAIRVAESMRALRPIVRGEKPKAGDGHIVLSTGVRDDGASAAAAKEAKRETATWGKSAAWAYYYGPVGQKTVGVAIFDHPSNPRHPTWWHVRDYGLFTANPFGQHYFENKPDKNLGDLKIASGQSVTFRYRFVFTEGDEKAAKIEGHYRKYVESSASK